MGYRAKVLVIAKHYLPGYKGGGPIKTLKNLFDQLGREISFDLITSDRDLGDESAYKAISPGLWNEVGSARVFYISPGLIGLKKIYSIMKSEGADVVYLNSFFSIRFSFFPRLVAKLFGLKVILSPRGEFSKGALSIKSPKKKAFIFLYNLLGLQKDVVFQASSIFERRDIELVLGEKVDVKVAVNIGSQEYVESVPLRKAGCLRAVFVSRVSPKKNLLGALETLREVRSPIVYHIYGPIEDEDYWGRCQCLIDVLPNHIEVEYKGELSPENIISTIADYDFLFLPTSGENYGHAIVEALCAGLPVMISDQTPWRNLEAQGIGWDLPLYDNKGFANAIELAHAMSVEEYSIFRERVLAWAKEKFSNPEAVEANKAMFDYALRK